MIEDNQIHQKEVELSYAGLKRLSLESKETADLEVLSFDYQQKMPLPHVVMYFLKDKFGLIIFALTQQKQTKITFFMYDESVAKKRQNEV